jgi:hypothetical protein
MRERECLLLAQSGHPTCTDECPLLGLTNRCLPNSIQEHGLAESHPASDVPGATVCGQDLLGLPKSQQLANVGLGGCESLIWTYFPARS